MNILIREIKENIRNANKAAKAQLSSAPRGHESEQTIAFYEGIIFVTDKLIEDFKKRPK